MASPPAVTGTRKTHLPPGRFSGITSETRSAFRIPLSAGWLLVGAVVLSQGVHIASMFISGWRKVLGIEPVAFTTWSILLAITLSKFIIVEAYNATTACVTS
jgi:hypothetical protein